VEFPAALEDRGAARQDDREASTYRFDLRGRIPLHGLRLTIAENVFSRPYQLAKLDQQENQDHWIATGLLARQASGNREDEVISFPEDFSARLEGTVTDDRNPPLTITAAMALSAARQLVFAAPDSDAKVLRLYYGNPGASAPHYDFAASVPQQLADAPLRLSLGEERSNPGYQPEPEPLSERSPWLIYAALGAASLVLFAILWRLAKSVSTDGGE